MKREDLQVDAHRFGNKLVACRLEEQSDIENGFALEMVTRLDKGVYEEAKASCIERPLTYMEKQSLADGKLSLARLMRDIA